MTPKWIEVGLQSLFLEGFLHPPEKQLKELGFTKVTEWNKGDKDTIWFHPLHWQQVDHKTKHDYWFGSFKLRALTEEAKQFAKDNPVFM